MWSAESAAVECFPIWALHGICSFAHRVPLPVHVISIAYRARVPRGTDVPRAYLRYSQEWPVGFRPHSSPGKVLGRRRSMPVIFTLISRSICIGIPASRVDNYVDCEKFLNPRFETAEAKIEAGKRARMNSCQNGVDQPFVASATFSISLSLCGSGIILARISARRRRLLS